MVTFWDSTVFGTYLPTQMPIYYLKLCGGRIDRQESDLVVVEGSRIMNDALKAGDEFSLFIFLTAHWPDFLYTERYL